MLSSHSSAWIRTHGGGYTLSVPASSSDQSLGIDALVADSGHPLALYAAGVPAQLPATQHLLNACQAHAQQSSGLWGWLIRDDFGQVSRIPLHAPPVRRDAAPDDQRPALRQALPQLPAERLISPLGPVLNTAVHASRTLVSAQLASHTAGQRVYGVGRAPDVRSSTTVALLEALERQAGLRNLSAARQCTAPFSALPNAVNPELLGLLHPAAYVRFPSGCRPFSQNDARTWVQGYDHHQRAWIWVEEHFVFYARTQRLPPIVNNSSGCAVGRTYEEAVLHGFLELAERDAALRWWYGLTPPRTLTLTEEEEERLAPLWTTGYTVRLFEITGPVGVPVVLAVAHQPCWDERRPAIYGVSGAGTSLNNARSGALGELLGGALPLTVQEQRRAAELSRSPDQVHSLDDHRLAYARPERSDLFNAKLNHSRPAGQTAELQLNTLQDLRAWTAERCGLISVDQTTPALHELGLTCVRVLAPGLIPMHYGHGFDRQVPDVVASPEPHPFA